MSAMYATRALQRTVSPTVRMMMRPSMVRMMTTFRPTARMMRPVPVSRDAARVLLPWMSANRCCRRRNKPVRREGTDTPGRYAPVAGAGLGFARLAAHHMRGR